MPFDAGSIVARLKLNSQEFKTGLQSGLSETRKFDRAMGNIFKGGALVAGVSFAAKQIYGLANDAAKLATVSDAFERMAGGAAKANDILARTRMVTGALSEREMVAAANQLELLGVGMQNLPRFTEIARSAAIGLGQDVGYMLQSLSTGTARQSRLWLDNLGIIISVEEANEAYARSLGKTAKELTDTEERAAFLFAVLDKGQTIIDKVGASTGTAAENIQSMGVFARDTADKLEKELIPAWSKWVELMQRARGGGAPTGPWDMPDILIGIKNWLDDRQNDLHNLAPGIFGPGPSTRGRGLSTATDSGMMPSASHVPSGLVAGTSQRQFERAMAQTAGAGDIGPAGMRFMGGSRAQLDWTQVEEPALTFGDTWTEQISLVGDALMGLGDAFSSFFEAMITGSGDAGAAFFSSLMNTLGQLASKMGDMLIWAGIGMQSLQALQGAPAIIAGIALKAISGLFRGIASNNSPGFSQTSRAAGRMRGPRDDEMQGSTTIIVEGDFIGDRVWIDRLIDKIRLSQRNRGTTVVFAG